MTKSAAKLVVLVAVALVLGACARVERRITITSEPSGAIVSLNDTEVGRTPVEVDFTYFGVYDVRLRKEGYEPIVTTAEAKAPLHEQPVDEPPPSAEGQVMFDGDAVSVVLQGPDGQRHGSGSVSAGSYDVLATFDTSPLQVVGRVTVPAGGAVTVRCQSRFRRCMAQ